VAFRVETMPTPNTIESRFVGYAPL